jgi:hypothetical protein
VIVAVRFAATGRVDTVKVPVVWVAWIVAVPSTVTPLAVLSLDRAMVRPPVGAGLEIVSVPVDGWPPTTVLGLSARPVSVGALTVREAEPLNVPAVAVTVVTVSVATGTVPTVVDAVVCPAWMVVVVGVKLRILLGLPVNVTVRLDAIGLASVAVPVTLPPPGTVFALSDRLSESGNTLSVSVVALLTLGVAVIVAGVCVVTTLVAIVIDLLVLFAVNVTGVWGVADVLELVSATV